MGTYVKGQAVTLDGAPAVILSADTGFAGQLLIATYPGWSAYIGTGHSGLAPMESASDVYAGRVTEIRAYYGLDVAPWVSRVDPGDRRALPDSFPERVLTHGVDYAPREVATEVTR